MAFTIWGKREELAKVAAHFQLDYSSKKHRAFAQRVMRRGMKNWSTIKESQAKVDPFGHKVYPVTINSPGLRLADFRQYLTEIADQWPGAEFLREFVYFLNDPFYAQETK